MTSDHLVTMLLSTITARPLKEPLPVLRPTSWVYVYHPGFPNSLPILNLQAFPSEPGSMVVGIPVGVVLDACFVLAGNQQGELQHKDSGKRIAGAESDADRLLTPGTYYFVVVVGPERQFDYDYQLCDSFASWTPPTVVPSRWLGSESPDDPLTQNISDISSAVKILDKVCIMTGAAGALRASHIIPKSQKAWFHSHFQIFAVHGGNAVVDLNSVHNEVTLREDLNEKVLDNGTCLFVPYRGDVVTVFVRSGANDVAHEFHLRKINFPNRIRRVYLFSRFAWNVFSFLSPGLQEVVTKIQNTLKRKATDSPTSKSKKLKEGSVGNDSSRQEEGVGSGSGSRYDEDVKGGSRGGSNAENSDSSLRTFDDQMALFEKVDEDLKTRPLTVEDVHIGRYPGFSKIKRLEFEYRRAHPEVSAVGVARVWEEGEHESDDGRGIE